MNSERENYVRKATMSLATALFAVVALAQSYQPGKILKWDLEAYGPKRNVTRNAAIYYIQIGSTEKIQKLQQTATSGGKTPAQIRASYSELADFRQQQAR